MYFNELYPTDWVKINEASFESWLKCPTTLDYYRNAWIQKLDYYFRYNNKKFATYINGKVYVDPKILKNPSEKPCN